MLNKFKIGDIVYPTCDCCNFFAQIHKLPNHNTTYYTIKKFGSDPSGGYSPENLRLIKTRLTDILYGIGE